MINLVTQAKKTLFAVKNATREKRYAYHISEGPVKSSEFWRKINKQTPLTLTHVQLSQASAVKWQKKSLLTDFSSYNPKVS